MTRDEREPLHLVATGLAAALANLGGPKPGIPAARHLSVLAESLQPHIARMHREDHFRRWLAACCVLNPGLSTRPARLFGSFRSWCWANGEPATENGQVRALIEATPGLRYTAKKGVRWVRGIDLRNESEGGEERGHASPL